MTCNGAYFEFNDIPSKIGKYCVNYIIDYGVFAAILNVIDINGHEFACKAISREKVIKAGLINRVDQELRVLERISHPNIVKVYEIIYTENYINIIMEYCSGGTLNEYLAKARITFAQIYRYSAALISAINYLHSKGICHRDIKLDNIVIDSNLNPKLLDFGLCYIESFQVDGLRGTFCGTLEYLPPEIIRGQIYDGKKADIWSLGVCIYIMIYGKLPFTGSDKEIMRKIINNEIVFEEFEYSDLVLIVKSMLINDPAKRISAHDLNEIVPDVNSNHLCQLKNINLSQTVQSMKQSRFIVKPLAKNELSARNFRPYKSRNHMILK